MINKGLFHGNFMRQTKLISFICVISENYLTNIVPDETLFFFIEKYWYFSYFSTKPGVVGWCKGAVYLTSLGRPTDIGLQLGKACYPCSG